MTNKKKRLLFGLMSIGLLGACGTGTNTNTEEQSSAVQETSESSQASETSSESSMASESTSSEESSTNNSTQPGINNQNLSISLEDAVKIFQDTYPSVSIESIQMDDDRNYEYDIDGFDEANEYELSIDANSGETRDQETGDNNDNDEEALNLENVLSPQEAMDIALNEIGTGYVDEWELDMENGAPVYEISIEETDNQDDDDMDITIHGETGEILKRD